MKVDWQQVVDWHNSHLTDWGAIVDWHNERQVDWDALIEGSNEFKYPTELDDVLLYEEGVVFTKGWGHRRKEWAVIQAPKSGPMVYKRERGDRWTRQWNGGSRWFYTRRFNVSERWANGEYEEFQPNYSMQYDGTWSKSGREQRSWFRDSIDEFFH